MKNIRLLLLMMLLICSPTRPAIAVGSGPVTGGPVDGSFTLNAPPTIYDLTIREANTLNTPAALSPFQYYDIFVRLTETTGIENITKIVVKLWYDASGAAFTQSDFDNITTGDVHDSLILTWTRPVSTAWSKVPPADSWTVTPSDLTTWVVTNVWILTPEDWGAAPDPTSITFQLRLKIGKVARETAGSSDKWQIASQFTNSSNLADYAYFSENGVEGIPMNWYGELNLLGGLSGVDWGLVQPGMTFTDASARQRLEKSNQGIGYLSNGDYQEMIKSSTQWENETDSSFKVNLSTDAAAQDTFALYAGFSPYANPAAQGAFMLNANGSYKTMRSTGVITSENGVAIVDHYMWLALNDALTRTGHYNGAITFGIANR